MNTLTVARFTLHEVVSRRLILAGALLSVAFVALYGLGFSFIYGKALENAGRRVASSGADQLFGAYILTTLGLYAVHFLSSFIALLVTVGAISGEIESGTLHAVLAHPIRRAEFVLGRWLAFAALGAAYVPLMAGLLLLIARVIAGYEAPDAPRAVALMLLGFTLLLTLSLLGSSLFSTLANGVVVFSLFGLAWLAGVIEFLGGVLANEAMTNLGIFVSLLVPSDALWRGASFYLQSPLLGALTAARGPVPFLSLSPPAGPFLIWSAVYIVACLSAAVLAFSRRDL